MAVNHSNLKRAQHLASLLQARKPLMLNDFVREQISRDLLGDDLLDAARAANLVPAVIYLTTLGVANLPPPNDRATWLAIYQSLGACSETEAFKKLSSYLPLKWIARAILADEPADKAALDRCARRKLALRSWIPAFELALDRRRPDLVEALVAAKLAHKTSTKDWVGIAKILCARENFLKDIWDAAALGRSLAMIRKQTPDTALFKDLRSMLAGRAAIFLMRGGDYAGAIKLGKACTAVSDREIRLTTLAEASCKAGELENCIGHLDEVMAWTLTAPQQEALKKARELAHSPKKQTQAYDVPAASRALTDLQDVLDKCGQKAFLVSGTLLGYAREGRLLSHDKDIDVGILRWQDQYDVAAALLESGRFWVRIPSIGDSGAYYIPIMHLPTRVTIDIFIYHREGDQLVTATPHFYGHTQKFAFTPFELMQVPFLDTKVCVPDDVECNLAENFGADWRVPDPCYLSHLESPSTVDAGGLDYQITGRLLLLNALRSGKLKRALRALKALENHRDRPCGLNGCLLQGFAALCEELALDSVKTAVA